MKLFLLLFFLLSSFNSYGHGGHGAFMQGDHVKAMRDKLEFKNTLTQIITNDSDDPTAVAKAGAIGSMYIRSTTGALYQKQDAGSSTNWLPLIIGPSGSGTDECVTRWDGTGTPNLQDSIFCITDLGYGTGLTQLDVDNIKLDGNTVSSIDVNGNILLTPNGIGNVNSAGNLVVDSTSVTMVDPKPVLNNGGNQVAADGIAGLQVSMSDATDASLVYDSTLTSKWKIGELAAEVEVADVSSTQTMTNKEISNGATVNTNLYLEIAGTAKSSKPCPSMTEIQRDALTAVSGGCVFNTDTSKINFYNGSIWATADGGLNKWLTSVVYKIDDVIWESTSNNIYRANADHTSGVFLTDIANWTELTNDIPVIGTPTYTSTDDVSKLVHSTGVITHVAITDNGDGTVDITAVDGFIRATNSELVELLSFSLGATSSLALTDLNISWIYIEYNAGSPQVVATTTERTDFNTNVLLGKVYRNGLVIHKNDAEHIHVGNIASLLNQRLFKTEPYDHESGSIASETGTLNLAITAGKFWHGLDTFTTPAYDTSAADIFTYYYLDGGGGWTAVSSQTQVDNLQYDDGTGVLATLGNAKYGVHWIYNTANGHIGVLYGSGSYSLAEAQQAQPGGVPPAMEAHGFLIAKVIIQKSDTTFTSIESSFDTLFTSVGVNDHNLLFNLQGGAAAEYYHLDSTEFGFLDGQDQSVLTTGTPSFADLTIDNMYLNLNTFSTTAGDLTFAPFTSITNVTGDLSVSGRIDGEGSKILGNDPYKQFNKSAYAEYSVIGDFSTGQNATFDGGGTITAGEPSIETGALDTTDTNFYQYDMGAVNDYFYLTIPVDQDRTIGYRFRYSYDGDDDDIDLEIKCATSGTILTDNNPMPVKANTLTSMTGSIFVPTGCGDLKFGWSVATFNSGKVFKFNRVTTTDNPWVDKNLTVSQDYRINQAGSAMTDLTGEQEFNLATATITDAGEGLIVASDDSGNIRTKFTAVRAIKKVVVSGSAWLVTANRSLGLALYNSSDTLLRVYSGNNNATAATTTGFSANFSMVTGDYFTFSTLNNGDAVDTSLIHSSASNDIRLNITALSESRNVMSPATSTLSDWTAYTPTGDWTTNTTYTGAWRRVGDVMEIRVNQYFAGQPAAGGSNFTIPSGYTVDNSKLEAGSADFQIIGEWYMNDTGTTSYGGPVNYRISNGNFTAHEGDGTAGGITNTAPITIASGDSISITVRVPITGWDSLASFLAAIPTMKIAYIKDVKANTTAGGTFTSGAWQTRDLNTLTGDTEFISLASNRFTLQPGKYDIEVEAPGVAVNLHKAKLVGDPAGTPFDALLGANAYENSTTTYSQGKSFIQGSLDITTATTYEVQHRCGVTYATNGFGLPMSIGVDEIYTQVKITQILAR